MRLKTFDSSTSHTHQEHQVYEHIIGQASMNKCLNAFILNVALDFSIFLGWRSKYSPNKYVFLFSHSDLDCKKFEHSHPASSGTRRAAGVVQTRLPDHHATSGKRSTGKLQGTWKYYQKVQLQFIIHSKWFSQQNEILRSSLLLFSFNWRETMGWWLNAELTLCLCTSLCVFVLFALGVWMSVPSSTTSSVCVLPLIVMVSPSLCLHSRSRLSASSSNSSSWPQPVGRDQDLLPCSWAPGPQPLRPRVRGAWSNPASWESAAAHWLVARVHSRKWKLSFNHFFHIIFTFFILKWIKNLCFYFFNDKITTRSSFISQ